jgi:tetratricopeptide (TPR) repeat protein
VATAQTSGQQTAQEFRQALSLAQQGRAPQALVLTEELLKRHPGYAPALKLEGMLLEAAGHGDEAEAAYERGLRAAPEDGDLLYKVGLHELVAGRAEEAAQHLAHYTRLEPGDGDGFFYLAQAEHLVGRDDRALTAITEALRLEPGNATVWQKYGELLCGAGDSENGLAWLRKAQGANPRLERLNFDLAVASLNTMNLDDALKFAEEAVNERPGDMETLKLLASIQGKLAQWQESKATYARILAAKSEDAEALLGMGHSLVELKEIHDAIDTLNRLLAIDPANAQAHYYLAQVYMQMGDKAEAQHHADLHHAMMQQESFSASALGAEQDRAVWDEAKRALAAHKEAEALELFRTHTTGPAATVGHPYLLVGALYLYSGDAGGGVRLLRRALTLEPKIRGARTYLGILALQQNRLDVAEKEFKTELENDPNYETAIAELGAVRHRQERWAEAAELLARSHTRTPALLVALSDAYFHLGRVKDANLTAEIASAFARDDEELRGQIEELLKRNGQTELAARLAGRVSSSAQ